MRSPWLPLTLVLLAPVLGVCRPDPPAALGADERLLREAGVGTDGGELLAFFRRNTPSAAEKQRLAALIKQLGDNDFTVREKASRELEKAGRPALPLLRKALESTDAEVVRRATECRDFIERTPYPLLVGAAARMLAQRPPDGAAEVLLAFVPFAEEEVSEDAVFEALAVVGLTRPGEAGGPVKAVEAALKDEEPRRRAAAAFVLGRSNKEQRPVLVRLLADDDPRVRYQAAVALARAGEREAVPVLVALLADAPLAVAWQAEDVLVRLAGDAAPVASLGSGEEAARRRCQAAWQAWWKANADKADLARLMKDDGLQGLTVICEVERIGQNPGHVRGFGRDGRERWHAEGMDSPADVHLLRGGRILVGEHWATRVTERDLKGSVLWEYKTAAHVVSCRRLPDGNTFIATSDELLEVTPEKKVVYSYRPQKGMLYNADKLPNGHILFINGSGTVTELDRTGKEVKAFTPRKYAEGASAWASVEPLPGGRYLIALSGTGRVVEVNGEGEILWECAAVSPTWATRLRNGNTLVTSVNGHFALEVDRDGKEVWKKEISYRPFRARRY
jgi:hypothetical protein